LKGQDGGPIDSESFRELTSIARTNGGTASLNGGHTFIQVPLWTADATETVHWGAYHRTGAIRFIAAKKAP